MPYEAGPADPELDEVVAAWPRMTAKVRAAVLAIVRGEIAERTRAGVAFPEDERQAFAEITGTSAADRGQ